MSSKNELALIYLAAVLSFIFLCFVYYQSQGVEGGLDSWNHFLISKCAIHHHELFLDQWNKPVFTVATVLVCQFGMGALIVFNLLCTTFSGLLLALAFRNSEFKNTWLLVPFTVFVPILFSNTVSGLTEPLNALILSLILFLWQRNHLKSAVIVASFLPFVRTEGFVILSAIALLIVLKKEYKLLLFLISGTVFMNLLGFAITGAPFWIITENPYWKHEVSGTFEAGSGSILHYVRQTRQIFGLPLSILFCLTILVLCYSVFKKLKVGQIFILALLIFVFYFTAHTTIYYLGILGSHGLTRVMAVIAPALAVLAFYSVNFFSARMNQKIGFGIAILISLAVFQTAYSEAGYAKPHRIKEVTVKPDKTQKNFIKAGEWLLENKLMSRTIISQSPFFDVYFDKDPYDLKSSSRIWSIDQKNDWAENGVIVIWDGFSAVREGNMKQEWLLNNSSYKLLHTIEGFEKPDYDPDMYKIYIFEKVPPSDPK